MMRYAGSLERLPRARGQRTLAALLVGFAAAGCSMFGGSSRQPDPGPDLGSVVAELPDAAPRVSVAAPPDRAAVIAAYQTIHDRVPDPQTQQAVGRRLADLTMEVADDHAASGAPDTYAEPIARYTALLDELSGPERAEVLYQLARAHDLAGDPEAARSNLDRLIAEHPAHPLVVEARFRRAEMAFSAGRWSAAEADYAYVVEHGRDSTWWRNAAYMSGWTRLRDGDPEGALDRFFAVLDATLESGPDAAAPASPDPDRSSQRSPAATPRSDAELVTDTLRATTLALGELDGPRTLADFMARLDRPVWQFQVYEALAGAYLARERHLDGVAVWQTFVDAQPLDARAPTAHRNAIGILIDADFPTEAHASKARFVDAYGIASEFWTTHDQNVRDTYLPALRSYLDDLARSAHATAQRSSKPDDYAAAARWYEELIATFPTDSELPSYLFLLGELHTEAGDPERAVAAYQRVMREFPAHPDAAEAGYAAVLGLAELAGHGSDRHRGDAGATDASDNPTVPEHTPRRAYIDAQIEFATRFPTDPRAPAVSAAAADGLFALGEYAQATTEARKLLESRPDLDPALRRTTLTVLGHGQFELGRNAEAEAAYQELLALGPEPTSRAAIVERLQAAIYKQAESSEQAEDTDAAVAHYLRIGSVAPATELAAQGHYDAVAALEAAGRPAEAARLLAEFRSRYPDHALAAAVPRRLAALYEELGDGRSAATAWLEVAATDDDLTVRRQALYRAGELELTGGDAAAAARHFAAYVEQYPRPADLHLEALHHLDVLAAQSGAVGPRLRWQQAIVDLERAIRTESSDAALRSRATALAAAAQFALAERARADFDAIRLVDPLAESLERKQKALRTALGAFEAAAAYEVTEYIAASTWHIGDLYAALAEALLTSERPAGLSPEALEQYDLLIEEQAFPFEEEAIAVHELNVARARDGRWDAWIERSFVALGELAPARFARPELIADAPATDAAPPREALEAAVTANPGDCAAQTALALELRRAGAFAEAEQHYLACLAAQPQYGPAQLNLGILYELYLGRLDAALAAYQRYQALTVEPDPQVTRWMQDIERRLDA